MADILFRPICSNCHCIIDETVDYQEIDFSSLRVDWKHYARMYHIIPYACKNCGSIFDSIEIPTKLPFCVSKDPDNPE